MRRSNILLAGIATVSLTAAASAHPEHQMAAAQATQPAPAARPAPAAQPAPAARPAPAQAAPAARAAPEQHGTTEMGFSSQRFRSHVAYLSDDRLQGREAGTPGYDAAARYVADQFRALGLRPGVRGEWMHPVTFGTATQAPGATFAVGDRNFPVGEAVGFAPRYNAQPVAVNAPAVFVGYGLDAPSLGHDSYRGVDVRGKVVVMLPALPQGLPSDVAAHLSSDRTRMAMERGAVGVITLRPAPTGGRGLPPLARLATAPTTTWLRPDGQPGPTGARGGFVAVADAPVGEALFAGAPQTYAQVMAAAAARQPVQSFALRPNVRASRASQNRQFNSSNVVAMIPGSDPALADEYVLLMAHLDHIGVEPERTPPQADRINNGAMDNATGISTLLEVAREFMETGNRPRRPILLAAVTAEEKGLLGSHAMAMNPFVDGRIVGVVNLDMPILTYNFQDVTAFGAEHSTMGTAVQRAAAGMNVGVIPDPLPEQSLFVRSDHYSFVQAGVPSVFLMTGFGGEGEQRFRHFLANEYHSPADQMSNLPFNWMAGARFAELNYRIAREIANAPQAPRWYQDSFFGNAFGGNQARAARPAAPAAPAPAAAR